MVEALKALGESYEILQLQEDWDDDGAAAPDPRAFNKAMIFAHLLLSKVEDLPAPEVNPLRNGAIDLSYRNESHSLLICVRADSASAYGHNRLTQGDEIKQPDLSVTKIEEWLRLHMSKPKVDDSKGV